MSRHRSVRGINYDEEYDDFYCDTYGQSVDDSSMCVSPGLERQYMFDRERQTHAAVSDYVPLLGTGDAKEGDDEMNDENSASQRQRQDSTAATFPKSLSPVSEGKLKSCMDDLRDFVGDSFSEGQLLDAALRANFNVNEASNILFDETSKPDLERVDSAGSATSMEDLKQKLENICRDESKVPAVVVQKPASLLPSKSSSKSGSSSSTPRAMISPSPSMSRPSPRESTRTKLDAVAEYEKERGSGERRSLNLVVIGHVDAGKSTLMGHLLFKLGVVNQRTMHKFEQESKKAGKQSFAFAWVLDETGEERSRGITMDVGLSKFETPKRTVTLLDAPGHKDFIPNMITGVSQADVALLVVDATRGEFETGFESGGQTREHALLARSLGVSQMGVVVNKLDNENWSQSRFDEIVSKLSSFLQKHVGLRDSDVVYIPCSGLTGENLVDGPTEENLKSWYRGPCLLDVIDNFKPPERPVGKPFRLSVTDVFRSASALVSIGGRVECGVVRAGDRVIVMPQAEQCVVKALVVENSPSPSQTAFAGDQVVVSLSGIEAQNIALGSVLCDPCKLVPVASKFTARIVVFNIDVPITRGFPVVFHQNSLSEQACVKKLIAVVHRSTGEVIRSKPRCLAKNSSALVEIEVARPVCVELYKDVKELGRFTLRAGGSTICAGMITEM